jgi:pSer/pThr/pTyr-binding forkhead associated (FHA) protein
MPQGERHANLLLRQVHAVGDGDTTSPSPLAATVHAREVEMSALRLIGSHGEIFLIQGETTFGRDSECSHTLEDAQVSRRHATVYPASGGLWIRDESSANGTFLNGSRLTAPVALSSGDEIRIGSTVLSVPADLVSSAPAAAPQPAASAPTRRSRLPLIIGGCAVLGLCVVAGVAGAILVPRSGFLAGLPGFGNLTSGSAYTLEDALADQTVDDRPEVMAYLGRPDAFTISQIIVDGVPVRVETWRYYGFGTRVDFVDGEAALTMDIEPVPDDTILPAWYDPLAFELGMSLGEAALAASAGSPASMSPEAVDLSDGGEDLAGARMLVGDQIVIGLDSTGVVYVETMALFPAEEGG